MKRVIAIGIAVVIAATFAGATGHNVYVFVGDTGSAYPWYSPDEGMRCQMLFDRDKIDYAGTITEFELEKNLPSGTYGNVKFYLCHTALSALTTNFSTNYGGNTPKMVASFSSYVLPNVGGVYPIPMAETFDYNNRDESDDDDNRWGFENRRTRLRFFGNVVDPTWKYFIQSDFGTSGTLGLLDAYIKKDFENNWYALGGKFVLPFSREMLVSHSKQLLVERSIVQNYFLVGRSQGVMFGYKGEQFKFDAAISDGMGAAGGTAAGALVEDSEYALTARAEFLAQGTWDQFKDFTSWEGEEFGFLLGGAVHFESDEYGTAAGPESETFRWTVDGSFEFGAANLYAAIFGNHVTADGMEDMDQYGFVLHGGVFLNEDWELFGRYEWADEDATGIDDLNIITVGIVKYFSGHQIKWTTDLGYALDEVTSTFSTAGAGWQADASGQDGQTVLRTQLQLLF